MNDITYIEQILQLLLVLIPVLALLAGGAWICDTFFGDKK